MEGYGYRLTDTSTLEVDVKREQGLNSLFSQLNVQGFRYKVCVTRPTVWKSCLSLWLMATRERKHDPPVLDSLAEYLDQRDYAVRTYLDSNLGATCDYDVSLFCYFRQPNWCPDWRYGGFDYMQFIVPGLIMMAVITNAYSNVAASFYGAKFQRSIEELLVAPVPTHIVIIGYVGGGVARGICVGILVTIISLFFVPLHVHSWSMIALTLILTAILFSLGGLLNAVFAKTFDDISLVPTLC